MTATTRGTMRPNGRSPPFLAIGLFIALCVMGFNYWNLSAKNAEQANEISMLNAEKLSARSTAEKQISGLNQQIEKVQRDLSTAQAQKETEVNRLAEEKKNIEDECDRDKRTITGQLEQCQELSNRLKAEVEGFSCDEQKCQPFIGAVREQTLREVYQEVGVAPLLTMKQKNIDLGKLGDELSEAFQIEIQRQQQMMQQQQVGQQQPNQAQQQPQQQPQQQQPQQQPQEAGNQQQPDNQGNQLPGQQQDQVNIAEDGKNLPNLDPHGINRADRVKVYGNEENRGAFFQPRVGMNLGDGSQNEAGNLGEREAGRLGSLVDRLWDQNQKGDTGVAGDSNNPVLPKPVIEDTVNSPKDVAGPDDKLLEDKLSADNAKPPADDQKPPADDDRPPVDDDKPPVDDDKHPVDDDKDLDDNEDDDANDADDIEDDDDALDADEKKFDNIRKEMEMGPA